jgi:hypothetical protein
MIGAGRCGSAPDLRLPGKHSPMACRSAEEDRPQWSVALAGGWRVDGVCIRRFMKKLSLDLEKLAVESFGTGAEAARPVGTVRGNALEQANDPEAVAAPASRTCPGNLSCEYSCNPCQLTTCYTAYPCCQIR